MGSNERFLNGVEGTGAESKDQMTFSPISHGAKVSAHVTASSLEVIDAGNCLSIDPSRSSRVDERGDAIDMLDFPTKYETTIPGNETTKSKIKKTLKQNKVLASSPTLAAHKQKRKSRRLCKQRRRNSDALKNGPHCIKTSLSSALDESPISTKNVMLLTPKRNKIVSSLLDARGIWVKEQLMGMNVTQLRKIAEEIDVSFSKETKRQDLQK